MLLEVCGRVTVSSGVVDWVEVGADPVAAVVAEGAAKPEAAFTMTAKTSALDTLAHWVQITRQALDDASYIRSLIESKLRRGLFAKAEADMATAIDAAATQTATTSTAAGGNIMKSIRVGIGKVEASGYNPNAVLLNPTDYANLDIEAMATCGHRSGAHVDVLGSHPGGVLVDHGGQGVRRRLRQRRRPVRPRGHQRVRVRLARVAVHLEHPGDPGRGPDQVGRDRPVGDLRMQRRRLGV